MRSPLSDWSQRDFPSVSATFILASRACKDRGGEFWTLVAICNERLGAIGFLIIAVFLALIWGGSVILRGELPAPR